MVEDSGYADYPLLVKHKRRLVELSSTALETAPTVGAVLCSSKSRDKTAQMSRRMEHCSIEDKEDGSEGYAGQESNESALSIV